MKRNEYLKEIAVSCNFKIVAEIGVHKCNFSNQILKIFNPSEAFLIDPFGKTPEGTYFDFSQYSENDWELLYKKATEKFIKNNSVKVIRELSHNAVSLFPDKYFDFVYIDGNHQYEFIKQDIVEWLPKVKTGGILAGHDYLGFPGVTKAVDEILGNSFSLTTEKLYKSFFHTVK